MGSALVLQVLGEVDGRHPPHAMPNHGDFIGISNNARYATGIVYSPTESALTEWGSGSRLVVC